MSALASGNGLPGFGLVPKWFGDGANWWGPEGLLAHIREHVLYTLLIVIVATLIALPLGLLIGHTGRGVVIVVGLANGLRAVPTLGLVVLLFVWLQPKIHSKASIPGLVDRGGLGSFVPVVAGLIVLALPPILTNSYAGVQSVDPNARDAARGMGMTGWQVLRKIEFPCALPLIMSGIRSTTLQVIATVTVAAYVPGLGGLGTYIRDGISSLPNPQYGYPAMLAAGIVVAVLAVLADGLLNLLERLVVSPGVSGRFSMRRARRDTTAFAAREARLIDA